MSRLGSGKTAVASAPAGDTSGAPENGAPARSAYAAWAVVALSAALTVGYAVLGLSRTRAIGPFGPPLVSDVVGMLPFVVLAAVGAVIATQQPRNPLGWLLMLPAISSGLANVATEYALRAIVLQHGSWLGGHFALWLTYWVWVPAGFAAPLSFLLLPNGRFLSRRWRRVGLATLAVLLTAALVAAVGPGLPGTPPQLRNPLGLGVAPALTTALFATFPPALGLLTVVGFVSLVLRYRRAGAIERLQLKWVLFASIGAPVSFVMSAVATPSFNAEHPVFAVLNAVINLASVVAIAVALGFAILKYRLYDIDVVISRTLVYGALGAFITAVYVGIVVGIGGLIGRGSQPNLVLSIVATAVVATAFQPVRERVQRVANRLVYGKRATPYEVLSEFSVRMAETYAGEQVLPRMAQVLAEGTGAESARVWLRVGTSLHPAAAWPADAGGGDVAVELDGQVLPELPGADRTVPVRHQGELLGALSVRKRSGESLTPIEDKLLDDLAHQAGLVLRNVGLTADLQARLVDLRASRQRLVAAQDEERRRLERNLHDGAQQYLVAIKVKLGLAEMCAARDPARAAELLEQLKGDTDETLKTLRDLARGIYPPLLAEQGLVAALQAQARRATVPVSVEGDGVGRYPQELEAAVYFCCLEALQNVQKYARANRAVVRLADHHGELAFAVEDDGAGFDPAVAVRGTGLQNVDDRLQALGGSAMITTAAGRGTTVQGRVPLHSVVAG